MRQRLVPLVLLLLLLLLGGDDIRDMATSTFSPPLGATSFPPAVSEAAEPARLISVEGRFSEVIEAAEPARLIMVAGRLLRGRWFIISLLPLSFSLSLSLAATGRCLDHCLALYLVEDK
jgi:hypothetical protein